MLAVVAVTVVVLPVPVARVVVVLPALPRQEQRAPLTLVGVVVAVH
jgi:hypothetical protein